MNKKISTNNLTTLDLNIILSLVSSQLLTDIQLLRLYKYFPAFTSDFNNPANSDCCELKQSIKAILESSDQSNLNDLIQLVLQEVHSKKLVPVFYNFKEYICALTILTIYHSL